MKHCGTGFHTETSFKEKGGTRKGGMKLTRWTARFEDLGKRWVAMPGGGKFINKKKGLKRQ